MTQGSFLQLLHPVGWPAVAAIQLPNHVQLNPMGCSIPCFSVLHHLLEFAQTHVYWFDDAIQQSHPLSPPSPALNLLQHQGLFQWVSSSHQVAKVLSFELFCRYWSPHQVEEVNCMLLTGTFTPDQLEPEGDDADFQWPYHQLVRRLSTCWSHPAPWMIQDSLLPLPGRVGHTILRAVSCCGPFCLAKQES